MAKVACGSCGRSPSRPTRTGSSSIATSTWTICASTRRRHYGVRPDPRLVQPSTVLALSRTLRAGSAGAAAFAAAPLTAAARGALPEGRSGRRDGRFRSNKGMLLIDLNEPHHPHHDQLLNLTHTTEYLMPADRLGEIARFRRGLSAGGNRIRTIGPAVRERR